MSEQPPPSQPEEVPPALDPSPSTQPRPSLDVTTPQPSSLGPSRTSKSISHSTDILPSVPSPRSRPLNGIFGLLKPSGPTSMSLLEQLKPLFASSSLFKNADGSLPQSILESQKGRRGRKANAGKGKGAPKIGQGGTLDPLADGVLVVGVGSGTKKLGGFLDCTKEYLTTALLGSATTSYDSQEPILFRSPFSHVGAETITNALEAFRGPQKQLPPLFSAVRIDGKRLFEYARNNEDLPRPVEARDVRVDRLELVRWFEGGQHPWTEPEKEVEEEEKKLVNRVRELAGLEVKKDLGGPDGGEGASAAAAAGGGGAEAGSSQPPAFTLSMTVSSGTYVRSIVHDVGVAVGSAAHVVVLTRTRQGEFYMAKADGEAEEEGGREEAVEKQGRDDGNCIPWPVFEKGIRELEGKLGPGEVDSKDEDGLREWERMLLARIRAC